MDPKIASLIRLGYLFYKQRDKFYYIRNISRTKTISFTVAICEVRFDNLEYNALCFRYGFDSRKFNGFEVGDLFMLVDIFEHECEHRHELGIIGKYFISDKVCLRCNMAGFDSKGWGDEINITDIDHYDVVASVIDDL